MTKKKIQKFAQSSIFDNAEYIGKWKDYDVWEPGFDDDESRFIGFPQFILVKGDSIRWSKDDVESRAIMEALWENRRPSKGHRGRANLYHEVRKIKKIDQRPNLRTNVPTCERNSIFDCKDTKKIADRPNN